MFFLMEAQLHLYLVPGKSEPARSTRHKSHILKVMFLAGVLARLQFKIWQTCVPLMEIQYLAFIIERVMATRCSVNHPAGTWETKPVSITSDKYREFLIEKVLLAIKAKQMARSGM